jgi:hypothetical protein
VVEPAASVRWKASEPAAQRWGKALVLSIYGYFPLFSNIEKKKWIKKRWSAELGLYKAAPRGLSWASSDFTPELPG